MNDVQRDPWTRSPQAGGAFAATLRELVAQAWVVVVREEREAGEDHGARAAQSRLLYLLAVAADHGVEVDTPPGRAPAGEVSMGPGGRGC